ncbi:hypothetical protein BDN71DRAFT_1442687, partial [Pleurotus eryngii]
TAQNSRGPRVGVRLYLLPRPFIDLLLTIPSPPDIGFRVNHASELPFWPVGHSLSAGGPVLCNRHSVTNSLCNAPYCMLPSSTRRQLRTKETSAAPTLVLSYYF